MKSEINVQTIAIEVGDIVKWTSTVNEINRYGKAIFKISKEHFPNDAITSIRQQEIYNWLCSISRAEYMAETRLQLIADFCLKISSNERKSDIVHILANNGFPPNILFKQQLTLLESQNFHPEVYKHSKGSFQYEKYAHAILETCKAFDKAVQEKTGLTKSGRALMQEAWAWKRNYLRATGGESESDENYHEGLKLLSEGVMAGVRNVTAHEPVLDWPINKEDCIDILHMLSFLYRQLDKSICVQLLMNR